MYERTHTLLHTEWKRNKPPLIFAQAKPSFILLNFMGVEFSFTPTSCNACAHDELPLVGDPEINQSTWVDPLPPPCGSTMDLVARDFVGVRVS
jgi:hypothetical protein